MSVLVNIFILYLAGIFVHCVVQGDNLIFRKSSEDEAKTILVMTWDGEETVTGCRIFTDSKVVNKILESADAEDVRTISEAGMESLLEDCLEFISKRSTDSEEMTRDENDLEPELAAPETTTEGYDGLPVIFPGTKWCGAGDKAKNYDDLGFHQDTDRCCRTHDHCNDTLAPGETRNNLTNKSPFTKLSCQCDNEFYECLDRVNSVTSNTIGNMYFNILKRECYAVDYPLKCKKYIWPFKKICIKHEKDTSKKKELQWIPAKKYKKIPMPGPLTITLPF